MEDNPALTPAIRQRYETLYSGVFYKRYVLGQWCMAQGLIYNFDREKHIEPVLPDGGRYYISVDYGTMNPFSAGLWCVQEHRAVRIREYYYDGRASGRTLTDEQYYEALEKLAGDLNIEQVIIDPSAASFIALIRHRRRFSVRKAKNAVADGIRLVSSLLQAGRLQFMPCCTDILREFSLYRWDEGAQKDQPVKEHDHAMDDMRYFCATVLYRAWNERKE
jgi:PBSX family phage terminase large subunit